jgi:hypothetical protein
MGLADLREVMVVEVGRACRGIGMIIGCRGRGVWSILVVMEGETHNRQELMSVSLGRDRVGNQQRGEEIQRNEREVNVVAPKVQNPQANVSALNQNTMGGNEMEVGVLQ